MKYTLTIDSTKDLRGELASAFDELATHFTRWARMAAVDVGRGTGPAKKMAEGRVTAYDNASDFIRGIEVIIK